MDIPIFRKAIAFTNRPSIAVAVRTVMSFDKGPLFIKLCLFCFWGKKQPIRHATAWHALRRPGYIASPYLDVPPPADWSCVRHNLLKGGPIRKGVSHDPTLPQIMVCLYVQKTVLCSFGSTTGEIACFYHTIHTQSDFPDRVCHNQGSLYSDNRTLQDLPWSDLRNINCLRGNDLPHISEIGKLQGISSIIVGHDGNITFKVNGNNWNSLESRFFNKNLSENCFTPSNFTTNEYLM